jgi:hypothetical protein
MRFGKSRIALALVSLLSLAGCGQDDVDVNADPAAPVESRKALAPAKKTHLVLLSGQSNMSRMVWDNWDNEGTGNYLLKKVFEPTMRRAFPNDEFVFVAVAYGGRPISQWVPDGRIYTELVGDAKREIAGKNISTVTFIWRQGEEDHNSNALTNAYEGNLRKLYAQLKSDFPGHKINWVIGRLNDAKNRMTPSWEHYDNWMSIRKIEKDMAASMAPLATLVDCDSFNDDNHDEIHGAPSDYLRQQQAFADAAIDLINANQ